MVLPNTKPCPSSPTASVQASGQKPVKTPALAFYLPGKTHRVLGPEPAVIQSGFKQSSPPPNYRTTRRTCRGAFFAPRQPHRTNLTHRSGSVTGPFRKANRKESASTFHRARSTLHSIDAPHAREDALIYRTSVCARACSGRCYAFFVTFSRV